MDLSITLSVIALAIAAIIWLVVLEKRPVEPGNTRLIPTTPVIFVLLVVILLALAHLMTIVTGSPHMGRSRF
ncbi:MAG: hypothetical protein ACR2OR_10590 [Hyphomicrobiales bacterium]